MFPRFSYLSQLTYDQHLIANKVISATGYLPSGPMRDLIQSNLFGHLVGAQATVRGSQEVSSAVLDSGAATVDAIQKSTSEITGSVQSAATNIAQGLDNVVLANLAGTAITSGTIAISTALMLRKMDRLQSGIERLGTLFTEGMSIVVSQLEIQNNTLNDVREQLAKIHETLRSPLVTQATEWRNLGLERMAGGLWPEAVDAFTRAIGLDETDPISSQMLGKIFLDCVDKGASIHDPHKAYKFFSQSARFAEAFERKAPDLRKVHTESLLLAVTSLLACAASDRAKGRNRSTLDETLQTALKMASLIVEKDPTHLQARYLKAKLEVLTGDQDSAIATFGSLVREDVAYLTVAVNDADFALHSDIGKTTLKSMEGWYKAQVIESSNSIFELLRIAETWGVTINASVLKWLENESWTSADAVSKKIDSMECVEIAQRIPLHISVVDHALSLVRESCRLGIESRLTEARSEIEDLYSRIDWALRTDTGVGSMRKGDARKRIDEVIPSLDQALSGLSDPSKMEQLLSDLSSVATKLAEVNKIRASASDELNALRTRVCVISGRARSKVATTFLVVGCLFSLLVVVGTIVVDQMGFEIWKGASAVLMLLGIFVAVMPALFPALGMARSQFHEEREKSNSIIEEHAARLTAIEVSKSYVDVFRAESKVGDMQKWIREGSLPLIAPWVAYDRSRGVVMAVCEKCQAWDVKPWRRELRTVDFEKFTYTTTRLGGSQTHAMECRNCGHSWEVKR